MQVFLFDLDMTLIDSSALADLRRQQRWPEVKSNMNLIRAFPPQGALAPHQLPAKLKDAGHTIGIVTSSPEWYAKAILEQFRIPYEVLVSYGDTENHKPDPDPILEALQRIGVSSTDTVFYIGDDASDVEASYHAKIISIGVSWGPASLFELASAAPDIFIARPSTLVRTDRLLGRGYVGECLTDDLQVFPHWGSVLNCDDDPVVYALGRYFTASDPRHAASTLSTAVLTLKNDDGPAAVLGEALGIAVRILDWTPDYIVPVPMKPSQRRNRFEKLLEAGAAHVEDDEIEIVMDGLHCIKEVDGYKGMTALDRQAAIRGAFESAYEWGGSKILLVDDVYTTGETSGECARILKSQGAGEVRVLVLAKDQRTFVRMTCTACGRSMKIRTNGTTGEKFWGCSGYPDHCQHTENL
jgi:HAD superfamily hydrolase (TIGR01549 family)